MSVRLATTAVPGSVRAAGAPRLGSGRRLRIWEPAPPNRGARAASVSVVIPSHNYARYLPDAVRSALTQQGVSIEVIIVDDASSDDSLSVARRLAREDDRVSVLVNATNLGPVVTFNNGLARVRGEFVVRLDADDLLTPGSVARSVAVARAFPSVGLVYGHPVHFTGPVPDRHRDHVRHWTIWHGGQWLRDRCLSGHNVITSPEVLMRTSVLDRIGGQRPLAHTHDMEMWFRIAAFADVAHIEGPDQAWHREHDRSLSRRAASPLGIRILEEKLAAFDELFSGPAAAIPDAGRLHAMARATLAREALRRACHEYDRNRAGDGRTQSLVDFALRADARAGDSVEWRALQRRRSGALSGVTGRVWGTVAAVGGRAKDETRNRRWSRCGVYEPWARSSGTIVIPRSPEPLSVPHGRESFLRVSSVVRGTR